MATYGDNGNAVGAVDGIKPRANAFLASNDNTVDQRKQDLHSGQGLFVYMDKHPVA